MHAKTDLSLVGEKSKLQDDLVCYLIIIKVFIHLYKIHRKLEDQIVTERECREWQSYLSDHF